MTEMKDLILYIHGKDGSPAESGHYRPLFPDREVIGLDYRTFTPWEAGAEIREAVTRLEHGYNSITLIANSIGAYFSMNAGIGPMIRKAYFISPIVDMERLIMDMMSRAAISEGELESKGVIVTSSGEELSWDYLCYVRDHPVQWSVPTRILYGGHDILTDYQTISAFARAHGAELTVLEESGHWFLTDVQMQFLDRWIVG